MLSREQGRVAPRDDLRLVEGYHSPQLEVPVRLNTNESPFPPPVGFVEQWLAELRGQPLNRYPDRDAHVLRAALAAHLGQPAERLFCANGSNEVLQTMLLTYGGHGRRVLVFEPTYALHSHIARVTGTEVVVGERRADFTIDVDVARALIEEHGPTVVFACSPNNPTGTVEPEGAVEALLDATDGFVVVDEAYGEFAPRTALERVTDDRHLVVVRTYSKVWSLAALRLGFAVAPSWVVEELERVVLPYHLAVATQIAGRVALDRGAEMHDRVAFLVAERERIEAALDAMPGVRAYPSGANFVLLRIDHARAVWDALVRRGVLVRDCSGWPRL
ncbi:MAG TPA: aminotransferase class I/II-fold pyridoxal phosphate-dependent enzyme, partial [Acidimicrobiia bacterium]